MKTLTSLIACSILILACGCSKKAASFNSPEGTYDGKGTFNADMGSMKVTATLVLNADKTYEMNLKELGTLGKEVGNWSQSGQQITLTPDPSKITNETLKAMSSNKRPHTVTINAENSEISWLDGPMNLKFTRAEAK